MTWNLEWFPGGTPKFDPVAASNHVAKAQSVLSAAKPDVLFLQEVRDLASAELAVAKNPELKVHVVSRFTAREGGGNQQLVIASRFEALKAWSEPWRKGWASAPRGFAFALLEIEGRNVLAYTMHLKANTGGPSEARENADKREDAVTQLMDHIEAMRKEYGADYVIAGGDLNTSPDRTRLDGEKTFEILQGRGLHWTFDGVPFAQRVTCPAKGQYPDACFDHILTRGFGEPRASVLRDAQGSDHRPVSAALKLLD